MKTTITQQPSKELVRAVRRQAGHTQAQAADTVHLSTSQRWHEYEAGDRNIDIARWELYLLLTGQHPDMKVTARKVAKPLPEPDAPTERAARRVDQMVRPRTAATA